MYYKSRRCYVQNNCRTVKEDMRLVWLQHVYWMRMLLISIAERLADLPEVTDRLMQNPADIAEVFERFYSAEVTEPVEALLTEHLKIGAELITALRDNQKERAAELTKLWYANADDTAKAFSALNPYYDFDMLVEMLHTHLDLTIAEVAAHLAGKYKESIDEFDEVEREAVAMADMFSSGIMRQFPGCFT